jgi:hypothetical protein
MSSVGVIPDIEVVGRCIRGVALRQRPDQRLFDCGRALQTRQRHLGCRIGLFE